MKGINLDSLEKDDGSFRCYQRRTGHPIGYTVKGSDGTMYLCGKHATREHCSDGYPFNHDFDNHAIYCEECSTRLDKV